MEPARPGGPGTAAGTRGSTPASEVIGVPVPGGTLAVEHIRSLSEPVLAIHGISSQRKLWNWLRAAAPGISLIAPDLRG
ncbi:MAG: alpha/beta fold hydrolase, partial [Streptosporangiaceae bacterium]